MLRHKNSDSESYNYRIEAFYDYSGIFSYHSNIMCLHKKKMIPYTWGIVTITQRTHKI